jgi:pilus assembly protein CpaD
MIEELRTQGRKGHARRKAATALLLGAAALSLSGCLSGEQYLSDNPAAAEYHEQHPIVLGKGVTTLDLFPAGDKLDDLTTTKIKGFAERYREFGASEITILTPVGDARTSTFVAQIRRELYVDGLRGYVGVSSYPAGDGRLASPIRLVYQGLKAEVADRCGQWPTDLASGSSIETWKNQHYPNFGCATQSALAAQIDDPRDLVQARGSSPPDEDMRLRAIQNVRKGTDPGTNWTVTTSNLGAVSN